MSNLSLLVRGTVVTHYYVDQVGIEELVVPNVAFPLKEIEHRAEHLRLTPMCKTLQQSVLLA